VGGIFFCSSNVEDPPDNGAILNIPKILKAIMSSAAKAELGALYINAWEAISMQLLLKEMGHKQPPTPIQTDNSTAHRVVTNPTTMHQGDEHEIPLATLPRRPRPIPILLVPRTRQPSQLLDKTSLRCSSH
jgi:hypothetical protein